MTKKAISKFAFLLFWYLIFEGKSFVEIMPTWTGRIINTERNLSSPLTVLRGCFCFSVLFGMITVKDSGSPFSHLWHLKRKHNDKNFEPGMNIMGPRHYGQLAYPSPHVYASYIGLWFFIRPKWPSFSRRRSVRELGQLPILPGIQHHLYFSSTLTRVGHSVSDYAVSFHCFFGCLWNIEDLHC